MLGSLQVLGSLETCKASRKRSGDLEASMLGNHDERLLFESLKPWKLGEHRKVGGLEAWPLKHCIHVFWGQTTWSLCGFCFAVLQGLRCLQIDLSLTVGVLEPC